MASEQTSHVPNSPFTEKQPSEANTSEIQDDPPNDSTRDNATEIYAWGCKWWMAKTGDSHGQMGISNKK